MSKKIFWLLTILIPCCFSGNATDTDTIKAVQFLADLQVPHIKNNKKITTGIRTSLVQVSFAHKGKEKIIRFTFPEKASIVATGADVRSGKKGKIDWPFNWDTSTSYKLLISIAADSASNFVLYSAYVFLPQPGKWKLIGTCKINGERGYIQQPSFFIAAGKKKDLTKENTHFSQAWLQRQSGSWLNLLGGETHIDSSRQAVIETSFIETMRTKSATDASNEAQGLYYTILKEGTGKAVQISDTVTVHYKGYLLKDGTIFDQTKEKPATFPLSRLIKGWQLGVPLCKTGGKIKLIIPSGLAYSIRTRAAKIPPNSILVFEIEVLDTRSKL
jgi:FKBP-type peptidyl-prolyl cis-trans isomerase FkpA